MFSQFSDYPSAHANAQNGLLDEYNNFSEFAQISNPESKERKGKRERKAHFSGKSRSVIFGFRK
jgi:hypothetical protein